MKRILIVDDEEDLTWSISKRLSRDRDTLEVMCANSGMQALEMLAHEHFDLIVTDLRMPGMSGWQLVTEVRTRHPETRIIVMTAFGSIEARKTLDAQLGTGYIEKPFEMNDLRKMIYHHLEVGEEGFNWSDHPPLSN